MTPPEIYRERDRERTLDREVRRDIVRPRDLDLAIGEGGIAESDLKRLRGGLREAELYEPRAVAPREPAALSIGQNPGRIQVFLDRSLPRDSISRGLFMEGKFRSPNLY